MEYFFDILFALLTVHCSVVTMLQFAHERATVRYSILYLISRILSNQTLFLFFFFDLFWLNSVFGPWLLKPDHYFDLSFEFEIQVTFHTISNMRIYILHVWCFQIQMFNIFGFFCEIKRNFFRGGQNQSEDL